MRQTVELKDRFDKNSLVLLVLILTTVAALSGCGGSGSGTSSTPGTANATATAPPDRVTARRAEAICARATHEAEALAGELAREIGHAASPERGIDAGLVRPGIQIFEKI